MTKTETTTQTVDLKALAKKINRSHEQCLGAARTTLQHALETGDLLIQAKEAAKHGTWEKWVKENCRFGFREAQRYMKVAKGISTLQAQGVDTTEMALTEVLGRLRKSKPNGEQNEATESCFLMSSRERAERLKRFMLDTPTLPESATGEVDSLVNKMVTNVKRAIRTGVLTKVHPTIEDGSIDAADLAIFLFEELRTKLSIAILFDNPRAEESDNHSSSTDATSSETHEPANAPIAA